MNKTTYQAKRLYAREILVFCLLGAILSPVSLVMINSTYSLVLQMCSLLSFLTALLFFGFATWWLKPLRIGQEGIQFGHSNISVSKMAGIEFRPKRNWLMISIKSSLFPRVRLLKIPNRPCNDDLVNQLIVWTSEHKLPFNHF